MDPPGNSIAAIPICSERRTRPWTGRTCSRERHRRWLPLPAKQIVEISRRIAARRAGFTLERALEKGEKAWRWLTLKTRGNALQRSLSNTLSTVCLVMGGGKILPSLPATLSHSGVVQWPSLLFPFHLSMIPYLLMSC